jgi:MinD-like ATPase involved in chromosome partitioning or flagellar assembly
MSDDFDPYGGIFQQQPTTPARRPAHAASPAQWGTAPAGPADPDGDYTPAAGPRWGEAPGPALSNPAAPQPGEPAADAVVATNGVQLNGAGTGDWPHNGAAGLLEDFGPEGLDTAGGPEWSAGALPQTEGSWSPEPVYADDAGDYAGGGYAGTYGGEAAQPTDPAPTFLPAARPAAAVRPTAAPAPVLYGRAAAPAVRESSYTPVALERLEIRRKAVPAKKGWRGFVHNLTKINLAPGPDEVYELGLKDTVQRLVRTTFPIAVVGVKGGVGKTVAVEALGSTFSSLRGDRVIAVDLDPDAGNLVSRHGRETALSIADLVADGSLTRYMDVRAHTSQNKVTRLEVLTSPDYAGSMMPLHRDEVEAVLPILREHYSLVLMDTGSGLKTNLMTTILGNSRALVVVSSAALDALEETQITLEWLRTNGYQHLLDSAVLLINQTQRGKAKVDVNKAVEQFSRQIRPERIFVMPFDDHIDEGQQITLELMSAASRRRYLEVAAAIAELFPTIGE